ncbi:MAG: calcium-binding protein [Sulfitobacter sp.]
MLMLVSMLVPMALVGWAVTDGDDGPEDDTLTGDAGDNELEGGMGNDTLSGLAGDDMLSGLAGDDTLLGHQGSDILQGQDGDDMLCAGDGDDFITGNRGEDLIEGQAGNDWASGDYNNDTIFGNEGNDTLIGGRGGDRVIGNEGDDVLFGGILEDAPLNMEEMQEFRDGASLADVINNEGRIDLRDDSVGNRLFGGAGDDQLFLGSFDQGTGGVGADTFNIMSAQNGDIPAVLMDYDETEDAITVVFSGDIDDAEVEVTTDEEGETAITVNGRLVGCIMNGAGANLTAADITVLRESDVVSLFDPNAAAA